MIRVRRPKQPSSQVLSSPRAERARADLAKFFKEDDTLEQRRPPFTHSIYGHPELRQELVELFHGKCAYCETPIVATGAMDVEQYRPKIRALNLDGTMAPNHYWWLAYEWTNLLPACAHCNRSKGSRFPVKRDRAAPGATKAELARERPLMLDPCVDDPTKHLVFTLDGHVVSETERGQATIELVSLNREGLVSERKRAIDELRIFLERAGELVRKRKRSVVEDTQLELRMTEVREQLDPARPYAAVRRQFVYEWLDDMGLTEGALADPARPLVKDEGSKARLVTKDDRRKAEGAFEEHLARQQSYSVEAEAPEATAAYYSGAKRIEWLEIRNFKAISRLKLTFPTPATEQESWLMLLGENAMGKSSVLQAVALALMGEKHAAELALDASAFVRRQGRERKGSVSVKLTNVPDPVTVEFSRGSRSFTCLTPDPKVLLRGYGATRLLRRPLAGESTGTSVEIRNLFDPTAPLADVVGWLSSPTRLPDEQWESVALALKDLLLLDEDDRFVRGPDGVHAQLLHSTVPLSQLSDGFQSVIALCGNIMMGLLEKWPSVEDAEAIVLLDEIEAHLHPTWKIEIVSRLRRIFPRIAFLVSTHDPLCLKGLHEGEIAVLERNARGRIVANTDIPPVNDLRADQILTSFLFGLHSTRGGDANAAISRYAELTGKRKRSEAEEEEFRLLRDRLADSLTPGETPAQRAVASVIERALVETEVPPVASSVATAPGKRRVRDAEAVELRRQVAKLLTPERP